MIYELSCIVPYQAYLSSSRGDNGFDEINMTEYAPVFFSSYCESLLTVMVVQQRRQRKHLPACPKQKEDTTT